MRIVLKAPSGLFALPVGTYTFGRSNDCDIVLAHPSVSRLHARIVVTADSVTLSDLGSANGTYAEGKRIVGTQVLTNENLLVMGTVVLDVTYERAEPGPVAAAQRALERPPLSRPGPPMAPTAAHSITAALRSGLEFAFANGRPLDAERAFALWAEDLLATVQRNEPIDEASRELAFDASVELALALRSKRWADYARSLSEATGVPLSAERRARLDQLELAR